MTSDELPAEIVEAFLARCRAERAARGLPPTIEDPAILDTVAVIVANFERQQDAAMRQRRRRTTTARTNTVNNE